ncbi:MAG TPA: hypothetical protein VIG08_08925 [Gemmatimonadales bacterium]|jgi:N-acetylneuraminic acid mutarotase
MSARVSPYLTYALAALFLGACTETSTEPVSTETPSAAEAAAANAWIAKATMPKGRFPAAVATVPNSAGQSIVYAIAGSSAQGAITRTVQAYNAATNTWSQKADAPVQVYNTNGAGVIGGKIYVSGGITIRRIGLEGLLVYDPATNIWSHKNNLPFPGNRGLTGVIANKLYILTGCGPGVDCDGPVFAFYRYDPATDQWTTLAAPSTAHRQGGGGVIGGRFYVAGGEEGDGRQLEVYDPSTNQWTIKASLPNARWAGASVAIAAKLYVIGGWTRKSDGAIAQVPTTSVYDPASNGWSHVSPLPKARSNIAASRVEVGGSARIEVIGGAGAGNNLQFTP